MPIRWRLTLWFSFILSGILIVSSVFIYALLQHYLFTTVDDDLREYSARVHGTLPHLEVMPEHLDYAVVHSYLPSANEFASPEIYIQFIDQNGDVVVKSSNLGNQQLPVNPAFLQRTLSGKVGIETVAAGPDARVRIMASPMLLRNKKLVLEVAQSLKQVDATMEQTRWALLAGILAALALAAVSGGLLSRRALSPVERITETARNIAAGTDLSSRVNYEGPMDEVGQMATTFDHMIERLDKAFASQRNFVGDASHELRSPLTVIRGNLDLLKRNLSHNDRQESMRAMESELERMRKIVNDLLLLAEVEAGNNGSRGLVSLSRVANETVARAKQFAGNHRVETGRIEELSLKGDEHKLNQMLGNLVENALKYTPEGGAVTVSLFKDGVWARMEVADTGIGVAAEHLPHVFDRFYRVDKARSRAGGGTGLGLAIVKGIAEQHGGKVTVDSEPGRGSTFTVWLKL